MSTTLDALIKPIKKFFDTFASPDAKETVEAAMTDFRKTSFGMQVLKSGEIIPGCTISSLEDAVELLSTMSAAQSTPLSSIPKRIVEAFTISGKYSPTLKEIQGQLQTAVLNGDILVVPWQNYSTAEQEHFFNALFANSPVPNISFEFRTPLMIEMQKQLIKYWRSVNSLPVPIALLSCDTKSAASVFQLLTKAAVKQCCISLHPSWGNSKKNSMAKEILNNFIVNNPQLEHLIISEVHYLPQNIPSDLIKAIITHPHLNKMTFQGYKTNPGIIKATLTLLQKKRALKVELEFDKYTWTDAQHVKYLRLCPSWDSTVEVQKSTAASPKPVLLSNPLNTSSIVDTSILGNTSSPSANNGSAPKFAILKS